MRQGWTQAEISRRSTVNKNAIRRILRAGPESDHIVQKSIVDRLSTTFIDFMDGGKNVEENSSQSTL